MAKLNSEADAITAMAGPAAQHLCQWMCPGASWREIKAHHEAGHAVAALLLGYFLHSVTIASTGGFTSFKTSAEPLSPQEEVMASSTVKPESDLRVALRIAGTYSKRDAIPVRQIFRRFKYQARHLVYSHGAEITRLATELLKRDTMTGIEIEMLLLTDHRFVRTVFDAREHHHDVQEYQTAAISQGRT